MMHRSDGVGRCLLARLLPLVLGVTSFHAPAAAQSWEDHAEQAVALHDAGQLDSALVLARLAIDEALQTPGLADTVVASLLLNHGAIAWEVGRYEAAESTLVAAIGIWNNLPPTPEQVPSIINIVTVLGRVYYALDKVPESEEAFRTAIQLTSDYVNPPYEMLGGLYWELAQVLQSQSDFGRFDSALAASANSYERHEGMSQRTVRALFRLACARGLNADIDGSYTTLNRILPSLKEGADTLSADDLATVFEITNRADPLLYEGRTDLKPSSMDLLEVVIRGASAKNPPMQPLLAQARMVLGGHQEADGLLEAAASNLAAALADFALLNDSSQRDHEIMAASLLATTLGELDKYQESDSLLMVTYQRHHDFIAGNTALAALLLDKLARAYERLGRSQEAIGAWQEMERILQPDPDPYIQNELLNVLRSLASTYLNLDEVDQARDYSVKATDLGHALQEQQQLTRHEDYLGALEILGALELSRGWPGALVAEDIHREAMAQAALLYGEDHPANARYLNQLAGDQFVWARDISGDFADAEQNFLQALRITSSAPQVDHRQAFNIRLPLTLLYIETGRLAEADAVARDMLNDAQAAFGNDPEFLVFAYGQMAELKVRFGQNEEALDFFKRAYEAALAQHGPDFPQTIEACEKLGEHYLRMSRLSEAKKCLFEAYNAANRINNPDLLVTVMLPMADVFMSAGHYGAVDSACQRIIQYERRGVVLNSTVLTSAIWKQGLAKWHLGQLDTALALAQEAIKIESVNDKPSYLNLSGKLQHLGRLYAEKGMMDSALACYDRSWRQAHARYAENWSVLSEPAALRFVDEFRRLSAGYLTFLCTVGLNDHTIPKAAEIILADKGIVSDGVMERARRVLRGADPAAAALIARIRDASQMRSRQYVSGPGSGGTATSTQTLDSLDREIDRLESELAHLSSASLKEGEMLEATPDNIVAALPDRTTLVDYVRVEHRDSFTDSLSSRYLALVLRKDAKPTVVDLGEASAIDEAVAAYRRHMSKFSAGETIMVPMDSLAHAKRSLAIYEKVWQPVLPYLGKAEAIMLSPDGALHVVAFAALQDSTGTYLIEKFTLHCLSASRDLLRMNEPSQRGRGLLAVGDPDYGASIEARQSQPAGVAAAAAPEAGGNRSRNIRSSCGSLATLTVSPLPATAREVQRLVESWHSHQADSVLTFLGPSASEDHVKQYAPGKEVVHVATHGFYLEGACEEEVGESSILQSDSLAYRENPLLRSGLLLAGANLHGADAGSTGEDGILTADEVAHLNLEGVRLVVLSACETGLGDVRQGEGVYGLRRAFLVAGAKTVISSLWPVPDEQTAEMMAQLYSEGDQPLVTRLREAQLAQLRAIRSSHGVDHPFSWAAFIAIGDWR